MQKGLQHHGNVKVLSDTYAERGLEIKTTQQCEGVVGCCHAVAAPFMSANGIVYMLGGKHQHPAQGRHTERTREVGVCQQHIISKQAT